MQASKCSQQRKRKKNTRKQSKSQRQTRKTHTDKEIWFLNEGQAAGSRTQGKKKENEKKNKKRSAFSITLGGEQGRRGGGREKEEGKERERKRGEEGERSLFLRGSRMKKRSGQWGGGCCVPLGEVWRR
ncbi:uncharacterized protein BO66DRAFT_177865 [Aspergillus aculeatinus CBS 121060]|uniref:Uncharacterized protein n=1 Tax=Aspergillus aculeatinus CBS 121060 TaxID=1448322 RepID=A0ACD1HK56_9EURO|nr:hypothetical protein BO66DRAFT_177865 [Aspergillus aculeatinus CBS 121060]RAH73994.1 hypothetical protein BO66DRAFT_177865 [Aspergillus aculeatinus CBS 121060]